MYNCKDVRWVAKFAEQPYDGGTYKPLGGNGAPSLTTLRLVSRDV